MNIQIFIDIVVFFNMQLIDYFSFFSFEEKEFQIFLEIQSSTSATDLILLYVKTNGNQMQ